MSPDDLTTALAHALMDYDAEMARIGRPFTPDTRAELMPGYSSVVERIVLPRLWEAGLATWALGQEESA